SASSTDREESYQRTRLFSSNRRGRGCRRKQTNARRDVSAVACTHKRGLAGMAGPTAGHRDAFAERDVTEHRPMGWVPHCALMPAALMNGHHFSTSALWKAPNASGVCNSRGGGSTPWSSRRWRVAGSDWAASTAALSLATMSLGVPLGA